MNKTSEMDVNELTKKKFQDQLKEELPDLINELFENEQIYEFVEYLLDSGWESYNNSILDDIREDESIWESFYMDGIELGLGQNDKKLEVGIDPTSCFDKLQRCSILASLPMSKRDYKRFIQKLESITQGKERQQWFREAPGCFYGEYATYGIED